MTTPATASLSRRDRLLVCAVVVLPQLGLCGAIAHAALGSPAAVDIGLLVVLYTVTGLGISVGFHRFFTHRSFSAVRPVAMLLGIAGSMALQGPIIRWVADHRRHHAFADKHGDPHSPNVAGSGFFHAHVGWLFSAEKTVARRFAPDVLSNPDVRRLDRLYPLWAGLSLSIPFAVGAWWSQSFGGGLLALLWGGLARIALIHHATWSVNSVCHRFGRQPFPVRDGSRDNSFVAWIGFGEGWHNSHHAFPSSARFGPRFDAGWLVVRLLERLHLVCDVRTGFK